MKLWILLASIMLAGPAQQTWTGKISDSACAAHHEQGEGVDPMSDADCTIACIRGGSRFVFVAGGKVYQIANQDEPNLSKLAGVEVRLTGELKDNSITVLKIEK